TRVVRVRPPTRFVVKKFHARSDGYVILLCDTVRELSQRQGVTKIARVLAMTASKRRARARRKSRSSNAGRIPGRAPEPAFSEQEEAFFRAGTELADGTGAIETFTDLDPPTTARRPSLW